MAYMGVLEPIHGRWVWPWREMGVGDWFHVPHELKAPGKVRTYAHVAGDRNGYHISVTANDPEKPGYARVERVDQPGGKQRNETNREVIEYGLVRERLRVSYGVELDQLQGWAELGIGQRFECYPKRQIEKPPRNMLVFHIPAGTEGQRFGVLMYKSGFRIERLEDDATLSSWLTSEALS